MSDATKDMESDDIQANRIIGELMAKLETERELRKVAQEDLQHFQMFLKGETPKEYRLHIRTTAVLFTSDRDRLRRILARIADKGIQIKGLTITVNWSAKLQQKADKEGKLKVLMEECERSMNENH